MPENHTFPAQVTKTQPLLCPTTCVHPPSPEVTYWYVKNPHRQLISQYTKPWGPSPDLKHHNKPRAPGHQCHTPCPHAYKQSREHSVYTLPVHNPTMQILMRILGSEVSIMSAFSTQQPQLLRMCSAQPLLSFVHCSTATLKTMLYTNILLTTCSPINPAGTSKGLFSTCWCRSLCTQCSLLDQKGHLHTTGMQYSYIIPYTTIAPSNLWFLWWIVFISPYLAAHLPGSIFKQVLFVSSILLIESSAPLRLFHVFLLIYTFFFGTLTLQSPLVVGAEEKSWRRALHRAI